MEQRVLDHLQPQNVFRFFEEICAIPHGSGNTKAISDYCAAFAKVRNLRFRQDEEDNIVIWKDASPGYEGHPTVMIQGHLDMVCAKEVDCPIDMEKEGLRLILTDDGFITADRTTLGGDDGIAVAMALAVLDDNTIPHPPLEVIFTSGEEIGLLGAAALDCSDLMGRILLNIDSEQEGVLTVGCAGGSRCDMERSLETSHGCGVCCSLLLDGFIGGHSGIEIDKGRANTNKLMGDLLNHLMEQFPIQILQLSGGKFDNAITNHTSAVVLIAHDQADAVQSSAKAWWDAARKPYTATDPNGTLSVSIAGEVCGNAVSVEDSRRIAQWICAIPDGVRAMSKEMPTLVETSSNLGIVHLDQGRIRITVSVRSSINRIWKAQLDELAAIAKQFGASFGCRGDYPAWEYKKESSLRPLMTEIYRELYGKEPVVEMTHGGLECGIFSEKLPGMDCVSFGPDLEEVHTPRERMSIASVERTWKYLLEILRRL